MTTTTIELDFELCRRILLRLEEVLLSGMSSRPSDYNFDGYTLEIISYNIQKLGDANLVSVQMGADWSKDQLRYWPIGFHKFGGIAFLAAAKDEKIWRAAHKTMESQFGPPTLKKLKTILLENVRADAK